MKTPPDRDDLDRELEALESYLRDTDQHPDRRLACFALGARCALQWVRGDLPGDPMYPSRSLSLLAIVLEHEPPPDCVCRTRACGHPAAWHRAGGVCMACGKACWS